MAYRAEKSATERDYKGTFPLRLDSLLFYLLKSLFGALFLYCFLIFSLPLLRMEEGYNIILEFIYIFFVMVVCDFIASNLANYIDVKLLKRYGYLRKPKTKKNRMFRITQYALYVLIRVIFLLSGLFWATYDFFLTWLIFPFNSVVTAFLLTCIILNLLSRSISWIASNIIFLK